MFCRKINFLARALLLLPLLALATGCKDSRTYSIATSSPSASYFGVGKAISSLLQKETDISIDLVSGSQLGSYVNCTKLLRKEVDFALAQNDTDIRPFLEKNTSIDESHIRTVLPLYPEILFIIYPRDLKPEPDSLKTLITGRKIGMGPVGSGTSKFLKVLFAHFGIEANEYTPVHTPFERNVVSSEIEVSCALTGFNNPRIRKMLSDGNLKLFSIGEYKYALKGSAVDGFCLHYNTAKPFIIPKGTFPRGPEIPVVSLAVDAVILTSIDVDKYVIYAMVETIYRQKQFLGNLNPLLKGVTEEFDKSSLNFPLHEGTVMYLERNKPSFFVRYSGVLGLLFSLVVFILGAFPAVRGCVRRKRLKKLYQETEEIREMMSTINSSEGCEEYIGKLREIQLKAFALMMHRKLAANEYFTNFVLFTDRLVSLIEERNEKVSAQRS